MSEYVHDGLNPDPVPAAKSKRRKRTHGHRHCPFCSNRQAVHAHSSGKFEQLALPLILFRPYQCRSCRLRHYGSIFSERLSFDPQKVRTALLILFCLGLGLMLLDYLLHLPSPTGQS